MNSLRQQNLPSKCVFLIASIMFGLFNIVLLGRTIGFFVAWFGLICLCILWHMVLSFHFIFRTLSLGSSLGHFFKDVLIDIPCVGCTSSQGTNEETDACSRPLCTYIQILGYKKRQKDEKKNSTFFQCNLSVWTLYFLLFFALENIKKTALKICS